MTLTNAAKLADDAAAGGFQAKALAAMINEAQKTVLKDRTDDTAAEQNVAYDILRNPLVYKAAAAYLIAGNASIHASLTPSDADFLAAAAERWPYLVRVFRSDRI